MNEICLIIFYFDSIHTSHNDMPQIYGSMADVDIS